MMMFFGIETIESIKERDQKGDNFPLLTEVSFMNSKRPKRILMNFKTENADTYRVVEMPPDFFEHLKEQVEEFYHLNKSRLFQPKK